MRTRLAAITALTALTLVGCSTTASTPPATSSPKPGASAATTQPTPAADPEQIAQACADALHQAVAAGTEATRPAACEPLTETEYQDALLAAIQQHNQNGRDELQRQIDEAEQQDQ
jgi:PBP1b-binding outer membrane lipoprotein LpoB